MVVQDMVSGTNEIFMSVNDSLLYIDDDISEQQRSEVNNLINQELSQMDIRETHPSLENKYLPTNSSAFVLLENIYNLEDSNDSMSSSVEEEFTLGGIDMTKYTNLTTEDNELNYDNLYSSLSHSSLRRRSLTLSNASKNIMKNKWLIHNDNLAQLNESLEAELDKKRKAVEEINMIRKRKQMDFKPVNDYLKTRWEDGIRSCVAVGLECAKLELDNNNNNNNNNSNEDD